MAKTITNRKAAHTMHIFNLIPLLLLPIAVCAQSGPLLPAQLPDNQQLPAATVRLGFQGSGAIISGEGLVITHARAILPQLPAVFRKNLGAGYTAADPGKELPLPGISAALETDAIDVTDRILEGIPTDNYSESNRRAWIQRRMGRVREEISRGPRQEARIEPAFGGQRYRALVQSVFRDVRLVATLYDGPDSLLLLRLYADPDNLPATFQASNRPYQPGAIFLPAAKNTPLPDSIRTAGYPHGSDFYAPYAYLRMRAEEVLPAEATTLEGLLAIQREYATPEAEELRSRLNTTRQHLSVLQRDSMLEQRQTQEKTLFRQIHQDTAARRRFSGLRKELASTYETLAPLARANARLDALFSRNGPSVFQLVQQLTSLVQRWKRVKDQDDPAMPVEGIKRYLQQYVNDYNPERERALLEHTLTVYLNELDYRYRSGAAIQEYGFAGKEIPRMVAYLQQKSQLDTPARLLEVATKFPDSLMPRVQEDYGFQLFAKMLEDYEEMVLRPLQEERALARGLRRELVEAHQAVAGDKPFITDTDASLRYATAMPAPVTGSDSVQVYYGSGMVGSPLLSSRGELLGMLRPTYPRQSALSGVYAPAAQTVRSSSIELLWRWMDGLTQTHYLRRELEGGN